MNIVFIIELFLKKYLDASYCFPKTRLKANLKELKNTNDLRSYIQFKSIIFLFFKDGEGQYAFGFSAPNHARYETRNHEGEVRGSYKYLGPYDKPVEVRNLFVN